MTATMEGTTRSPIDIEVARVARRVLRSLRLLDPAPLVAIVATVGLYGWLTAIEPGALSYSGIALELTSAIPLVFAAVGQMIVISLGDIDLGTGYGIGLVNVIAAITMQHDALAGWLLVVAVVVGYGIIGFLVARRGLPAIIVTLGASFIWLGVGLLIAPTPAGSSPGWLSRLMALNPPGLPFPIVVSLIVMGIGGTIVTMSRAGVLLRAAGSNRGAVRVYGGNLIRIRVAGYLVAGLCVVLGGLSLTGLTGTGSVTGSSDYTLLAIAGVILGGGEFRGGKAPVVGVVCGALALALVTSVMGVLNVSSSFQTGIEGLVLVAALLVRRIVNWRRA